MKDGLKINGTDAWSKGICMGDGFLDKLGEPSELKDYISNESRLEHGSRYIVVDKVKSRSLTLTFNIHGRDVEDYEDKKQWLHQQLYKGLVDITVQNVTYYLLYTGKSVSYTLGGARRDGILTVGFDEPNPNNRING